MCICVMGETDQTADSNDIFLITIFFLYVLNVWMCWKSCITSSTTSVCNDTYNETKYLQSFHQHFHNWLVGNSQLKWFISKNSTFVQVGQALRPEFANFRSGIGPQVLYPSLLLVHTVSCLTLVEASIVPD